MEGWLAGEGRMGVVLVQSLMMGGCNYAADLSMVWLLPLLLEVEPLAYLEYHQIISI